MSTEPTSSSMNCCTCSYSNHGRMFKALMSAHVPEWREMEILRNQGMTRAS